MAAGGRVPSYGTYQEQYVCSSWAVEEGGNSAHEAVACIPDNYADSAVVPVVRGEGEEFYTDPRYQDNEIKQQMNCSESSASAVPLTSSSPGQPNGLTDPSLGDYPQNNVLYVLEDRVRHLVNVSIEEFRSDIQYIFYQEFGQYRQSLMAHEETARKSQHTCEDVTQQSCDLVCTNQPSDSSVCEGVRGDEEAAINECVIKLLTCAASITRALQRKEYAVT